MDQCPVREFHNSGCEVDIDNLLDGVFEMAEGLPEAEGQKYVLLYAIFSNFRGNVTAFDQDFYNRVFHHHILNGMDEVGRVEIARTAVHLLSKKMTDALAILHLQLGGTVAENIADAITRDDKRKMQAITDCIDQYQSALQECFTGHRVRMPSTVLN